ncbi:nuclear fragile X mental retardation protein interacting protein 1 [Blyttiomyces sp. JEL0837]|nr:nuclear fragile X mental retardation protein interacting protein 1 [Blyttiomyces sp. JEL0837]
MDKRKFCFLADFPIFTCDNCEKSFNNEMRYNAHLQTHKKCTMCDFTASAKIVSIHEDEAHVAGVKVPAVKEDPEEIARWIAERKKRWPSDSNIARKKGEEEERRRNKNKRNAEEGENGDEDNDNLSSNKRRNMDSGKGRGGVSDDRTNKYSEANARMRQQERKNLRGMVRIS